MPQLSTIVIPQSRQTFEELRQQGTLAESATANTEQDNQTIAQAVAQGVQAAVNSLEETLVATEDNRLSASTLAKTGDQNPASHSIIPSIMTLGRPVTALLPDPAMTNTAAMNPGYHSETVRPSDPGAGHPEVPSVSHVQVSHVLTNHGVLHKMKFAIIAIQEVT